MAFHQYAPPRQPIFRIPAIVLWLLGVLVVAHAARAFSSPAWSDRIINDYAFIPARYSIHYLTAHGIDPGNLFDRAVPFVSYMTIHGSFTHLAVNCLWLLAFGPVVARRFGGGLFLLFFLICGIAAAATHLALNWGSPMPVIGASGAVSGLMAAGIRILPTLARGSEARCLASILSRQVLFFTLFWGTVNVIAGLTGFGVGPEGGPIAWQAHLGGYFVGLLLAGPFDTLRSHAPEGALIP